jgi:hypothetical protein
MRRLLVAVALAMVALVGTACGSSRTPTTSPAASGSPGTSAGASGSAPGGASSAAKPGGTGTRQVCDAINQAVSDGETAVGTDVGSIVGHLAGGNQSEADKAKAAALAHLKEMAGKIRTAGAPAQDPAVRNAVQEAATNLEKLATDPGLLAGVKSAADVTPVIQKVNTAIGHLTTACV